MKMPEVYVVCTDYANEGIELLKNIFLSCNEYSRAAELSVQCGENHRLFIDTVSGFISIL